MSPPPKLGAKNIGNASLKSKTQAEWSVCSGVRIQPSIGCAAQPCTLSHIHSGTVRAQASAFTFRSDGVARPNNNNSGTGLRAREVPVGAWWPACRSYSGPYLVYDRSVLSEWKEHRGSVFRVHQSKGTCVCLLFQHHRFYFLSHLFYTCG